MKELCRITFDNSYELVAWFNRYDYKIVAITNYDNGFMAFYYKESKLDE